MAAYGRSCGADGLPPLTAAEVLTRTIHQDVAFRAGVTDILTTADQVLDKRQGVCQDFAHLALAILRAMRVPARYVSGYLHTAALRGKAHRIAADASHAWVEVLDTDAGWMGFDPANGRRVDGRYIVVARGRDYGDVCPLQGTFPGYGGAHRLQVWVDVQQI
jgi:transglutaminase-like putative cysteine protease